KPAELTGGVRYGHDGNEPVRTPSGTAEMTEEDLMLMSVSEGIAGGVRYG
ncbi:TPA: phage tail assembly protein T, partial [Escherichia coli]|nr:phage tail assembly protein T [Escherichia coli]HBA7298188.1 phage tail assembly protein T [Escherichia coli]HBB0055101.1 phage tail assembly protein T [Escherichia coli]